jgi:hypothetical protein
MTFTLWQMIYKNIIYKNSLQSNIFDSKIIHKSACNETELFMYVTCVAVSLMCQCDPNSNVKNKYAGIKAWQNRNLVATIKQLN